MCSLGRQWLARRHVITLNYWCDLDFSICTATPWCVSICMWYLRVFVCLGLGTAWIVLWSAALPRDAFDCLTSASTLQNSMTTDRYSAMLHSSICSDYHHMYIPHPSPSPLSLTSIKIDQSDWDNTLLCTGRYSDNPVWWTAFQMNCKDYVIETFPPHMKPTQQRQKDDCHGRCNLFCKQMTAWWMKNSWEELHLALISSVNSA